MMENSNQKNKKLIISIICIALLILFSVGIVYAFFTYSRIGARNNVLNTAALSFSFEDSEWIWLENAYPISTEKALTIESSGNGSDITQVDGGLAKFKVTGGHSSGTIHYYVSLVKNDLTSVYTSSSGTYSIDPSTKEGQLPDGAVSINLQSSPDNIHETTGLVDDIKELLYPTKSFTPTYTGSYINTQGSVSIDKLPLNDNNERVIGTGIMSGSTNTRYFELRMWINDTVHIDSDLRVACQNNSSDEATYGRGYCNPSTTGLPEGIKYVYSTGEYSKLYYSTKIKVETTDITSGVVESIPTITKTLTSLTAGLAPKDDSTFTNLYSNISSSNDTGLLKMKSTETDPYPIYYYRGNVTNNNLIFGGFCWKIVRTTETGGTKIIYNGVPNGGVCDATGTATQIGLKSFNSDYNFPVYIGYKYGNKYPTYYSKNSSEITGTIKYGNDVTYENGLYTLTDSLSATDWATVYNDSTANGFRVHHYTCWSSNDSCKTIYYIYYVNSGNAYYFKLEDGKKNTDYLNEMLVNNGDISSNANRELNAWYTENLITYESQLEDTVFCNDRSLANAGGWDINNSNSTNITFGAYLRLVIEKNPSLTCSNPNDRFTVSATNGNGQLKYPIGLLTADEYVFAGARSGTDNNSFYLNNGQNQWSLSPYFFGTDGFSFSLESTGKLTTNYFYSTLGLRPVVSLNKDVTFSSGDGSSSSPYIVGN